jgi:hypothetical protein
VPFSIATSYCFPVRLSVMVKVFALMGILSWWSFAWLLLRNARQINSGVSN